MSIITTNRHSRRLGGVVLPAAAIAALALAGCSSSGGSGGGTQPGGPTSQSGSAGSAGTTVTVRDASGHTGVLATAAGRTLYDSDQEHDAVLCKSGACTAIWLPLTVPAGQTPTGPSKLAGRLSTIMRPDGKTQVALDGKPLYMFSFDHGSGQVGGDGQKDSFDGTNFTWHVATAAAGGAPAPSSSAPSAPASSSNSGGYGGY